MEWWLYYWNDDYTIEIVAIIFLYKLISSSFVIIPSHTSYTSSNGRERGSRVKEERRSERAIFLEYCKHYIFSTFSKRSAATRGVGKFMVHYWNGGYTIEKVAHYWNGG